MNPRTAAIQAPLWGARARDWAEAQEQTARPGFAAVLERARVGPGTRVLDLGCGSGMAAKVAADRGATVTGLDAAGPLLAIARERTPAGDFREGDIEAPPFGDAAFDLVTAFNAIQYAGNPEVALAEVRRMLVPGGTLALMVWGAPEGMAMASVITALAPLLPPPPPGAGGPFALSRDGVLEALVAAAGFAAIETFEVDAPFAYPDRATALRGLHSSGVAVRAIGLAGEEAVSAVHEAAIAPFLQPDGGYRIGARFRCLFARA